MERVIIPLIFFTCKTNNKFKLSIKCVLLLQVILVLVHQRQWQVMDLGKSNVDTEIIKVKIYRNNNCSGTAIDESDYLANNVFL